MTACGCGSCGAEGIGKDSACSCPAGAGTASVLSISAANAATAGPTFTPRGTTWPTLEESTACTVLSMGCRKNDRGGGTASTGN